MKFRKVQRDERTIYVENKSYKYGYIFLTYALMADIFYRSIKFKEDPFDLLFLIIITGLGMGVYQYHKKIFSDSWKKIFVIILLISAFLGFIFSRFHLF